MKHRILALLLALAMVCCLFAGCGNTSKVEEAAEQVEEAAASAAEEVAETASEAAEQVEESAQAAAAETAAAVEELEANMDAFMAGDTNTVLYDYAGTYNDDGTYTSTGGIVYPVGSVSSEKDADYVIETWESIGMFDQGIDSYNDLPLIGQVRERTGVWVKFNDVSSSAESEQFQLAVAAGTLPAIGRYGNLYTGGLSVAYADEVVWDLTDYVEEYAPDWWACLNLSTDATIDSAYTSGMILQICGIAMAYEVDQGLFTNGKFLKNYNEQNGFAEDDILHLQSVDGLTTYMKWIKDTYNPTYTTVLDNTGAFTDMGNAFRTSLYQIGSTGVATYLSDDGKVVSGLVDEGYYNYLKWIADLYQYGVVDQDFYSTDMQEQEEYMYIGTGEEGVWNNSSGSLQGVSAYTDADGETVISTPLYNVLNDDGEYTFASERSLAGNAYAVATTVEEDEMIAALEYMNFFFTEPGFYFGNWGGEASGKDAPTSEGIYYFDENGEPAFTDALIAENETDTWILWRSVWKLAPYYEDPMVHYYTGNTGAAQLNAVSTWTYTPYEMGTKNTIPTGASLTTDESSAVATLATDLCTYADERLLKFIIGAEELNEDSWADFCGVLEDSYDLSGIIDYYQFAYEDYLAGNRTSAASAAPPPPPDGEGGPPPA